MSDNHVPATRVRQHRGGNFSRKRTFFAPVQILRAHADIRSLRFLDGDVQRRIRWRNHDLFVPRSCNQRQKRVKECRRFRQCLIHLPIPGNRNTAFSGAHRFVSASTPGSFRPPRNSSDAPPPVEICEILSATPDWCTAATESPPPTIEVAPAFVALATALAISSVPLANDGISNTPIGPFHTI